MLRAPINLYYDVTPTGTILNRFSKDLNSLDMYHWMFMWATQSFFSVFQILGVILVTKWYLVGLFPFLGIAMAWLTHIILPAQKENQRLNSLAKSPLLNQLSETSAGGATIKAFGNDEFFEKKFYELLENDLMTSINLNGTRSWLSLRVNLLSLVMLISSCSIFIWLRFTINPVLIGLTLTYIL